MFLSNYRSIVNQTLIADPKPLALHTTFYWCRNFIIFAIILKCAGFSGCDCISGNYKEEFWSGFIFISCLNDFLLYKSLYFTISKNFYGYYLATIIMIHNSVLVMCLVYLSKKYLDARAIILSIFIAFLFLLEAILSSFFCYSRRSLNNFAQFKEIGANMKINRAYATRMQLLALGDINIFLGFSILGKVHVPPAAKYDLTSILTSAFSLSTCLQQLAISINFNSEDLNQRRTAIGLSYIRIPFIFAIIMFWLIDILKTNSIFNKISLIIILDTLLVSLLINRTLLKDTKQFGSGLKDYYIRKTKKFDMSSEE